MPKPLPSLKHLLVEARFVEDEHFVVIARAALQESGGEVSRADLVERLKNMASKLAASDRTSTLHAVTLFKSGGNPGILDRTRLSEIADAVRMRREPPAVVHDNGTFMLVSPPALNFLLGRFPDLPHAVLTYKQPLGAKF